MSRGYFRLGVALTGLWLLAVAAIAVYEYSTRNIFCQFDSSTVSDAVCQHFFWSWVPTGKEAAFSPNLLQFLVAGLGPPIAGWLLGLSIIWVVKGFRPDAT